MITKPEGLLDNLSITFANGNPRSQFTVGKPACLVTKQLPNTGNGPGA
jgi:hypothetical protein